MKKYVLISSVLAISLVSNCMEKEKIIIIASPDKKSAVHIETNGIKCNAIMLHTNAPVFCAEPSASTQLTAKAQERISLQPKAVFFLNNEKIEQLRASLIQKNKILSQKTELFKTLNNAQGPVVGKQAIIENLIMLHSEDIDLDKQLNIHLTPEDQQLLGDLDNEIAQTIGRMYVLNKGILINKTTSIIDQLIPLYRKTGGIQKFVDNVLMKDKSGELFMPIKENCQNQINYLTETINNLTQALDKFTEPSQESSKK